MIWSEKQNPNRQPGEEEALTEKKPLQSKYLFEALGSPVYQID